MPKSSRALRITGFIIGGVVVALAAAVSAGELVWRRASARRLDQLDERARRRAPDAVPPFSHADVANLPPPVAR